MLSLRRSALVPVICPASFFWDADPSSKLCRYTICIQSLHLLPSADLPHSGKQGTQLTFHAKFVSCRNGLISSMQTVKGFTLCSSRQKEKPSPRPVGSPGPLSVRRPRPSRMAEIKLSVSSHGHPHTAFSRALNACSNSCSRRLY